MPVNSKHKEYSARESQWLRCRDCIKGSDSIKSKNTLYLPTLDKQDSDEYSAYKKRALFYGASGRTVQALMGALFRKDYILEYPEKLQFQLESITLDGKDFATFARDIVYEVLSLGRVGILTDVVGKAPNTRQYLATYTAENVINWKEQIIDSSKILTMVVLREFYDESIEHDPFAVETKEQFRVLYLGVESGGNGIRYQQDVYRLGEGGWKPVLDMHSAPVKIGVPLTEIPFDFINTYDLTAETEKPPLLDLVEVNLSHYRTSADLEHGAHYTALPTAWVAGFPKDSNLRIGSSVAWVSEETDAKAAYLEYTGQGLGALSDLKRDKEQLMAVLGARLLEENKKAAEAADTLKIRAASEAGSLTAIARNIASGIENALKRLAWWSGASEQQVEEVKFQLNTDFVDTRLSPQELAALMSMYQQGGISQDTFLYNLKRGEVLPDERSIEDEKDLLEISDNEAPDMSNVTPINRRFEIERDDEGRPNALKEV